MDCGEGEGPDHDVFEDGEGVVEVREREDVDAVRVAEEGGGQRPVFRYGVAGHNGDLESG